MFDPEVVPEELTQVRMGKIVRERYPDLDAEDQEAVRQQVVAAMTLTQRMKPAPGEVGANTALLDGVRQFVVDLTELDIDLIDRVNPFEAAYAVLARALNEATLKQVQAAINGKRINLTYEEARALAERAVAFKRDRGRLPDITSQDAWERRMAEGILYLQRHAAAARG